MGILAAIALPQYNKAVKKSEVAKILPLLRTTYEAYKVAKLRGVSFEDSGIETTNWM